MADYNRVRYPQMPQDVDPKIRDTFSELIRTLETKDKEPFQPTTVYGRTVEYGGPSLTGLTFIGLTNVGTPTADLWNVYETQVPRDVGTVVVTNPDVSPRTQVRIYLPKASMVEGRTITILMFSSGATYPFNTGIYTIAGDSFVTYPIPNPTISGTLSTPATTRFNGAPGMPTGLPLYALNGGTLYQVGAFDSSTSTFYGPLTDNFVTTVTPTLTLAVTAVQPLALTFRAYGNLWYQIP